MKKWNRSLSRLMSAALLAGLSCAGAGAENEGPWGAGSSSSYVSWEDSQGAVTEAGGQVVLALQGGRTVTFTSAHLGDTVTFDTDCRELLNNRICGRGMDNRTGAFIALEAVRRAAELGCKIGAYGAATAGEETTMNGAYFVASRVQPTLAIAVDVTFTSDYPGVTIATTGDVRVGGGPVLVNNPACHRKIQDLLRKAGEELGIPVQVEAANGRTGTDGDVIHKTGQGVPFSLVSIPLRYMHTPAELGSLTDIDQCIELLARFLCDLDEGLDLTWY